MSAAPLKHPITMNIIIKQLAFRAHVSAAPLKLPNSPLGPRFDLTFRAHVSAAPLKPPELRDARNRLQALPRSRERGPVEASRARKASEASLPSFRAHVSAAPLKPIVG